MRIALISDIHGNLVALDSVLRELAQEPIDQIICLGDVAALGPQPHEVIERLRQLRCPVILGNTDAWLLRPPGAKTADSAILSAITSWCREQLTPEDRDYLQTFSPLLELSLDAEKRLLCYHGSPHSFDDVIASITPDTDVQAMLSGYSATVFAGGHTHIQMIRRYQNAHIVNVGSIGLPGVNAGSPELPMNHHVRWAEYGVLSNEHGRLSIDLRRTPLDLAKLRESGSNSAMPYLDWWLQKWDNND
jgi:predicted phosphodiesterase